MLRAGTINPKRSCVGGSSSPVNDEPCHYRRVRDDDYRAELLVIEP
jgi:hypothetical protein